MYIKNYEAFEWHAITYIVIKYNVILPSEAK